jgi:hypothetical protein
MFVLMCHRHKPLDPINRMLFEVWYKEHIQAIGTNKTQNMLTYIQTQDTHYSTIDETSEILHIEKKGQLLNTPEHFYIYNLTKLQTNYTFTDYITPYCI